MNTPPPAPAPKAYPQVRRAQRWNIVWVVPIIALLLGAWMLYRNFASQGPVATIQFNTAEEIYEGKTEVRCRSVKVGTVKSVKLSKDLSTVRVVAEFLPDHDHLLRAGSRFWVVKPRLSAAEVSGLGTLIQGAYIELDPGPANAKRTHTYVGLEEPPATNSNVPGRRITLRAKQAGLLEIGAPVHYRGFEVGRIEERRLSEDGTSITYNAFIEEEFSELVTDNTRFWISSGIVVNTTPQGVSLYTPPLQAIVSGGVSFGVPVGLEAGAPCQDGHVYTLFPDKETAKHPDLHPSMQLLLLFDQSVRGLTTTSAVEFRGIPIGYICRISRDLIPTGNERRIPVLVEIDPSRIHHPDKTGTATDNQAFLRQEVAKGLRAGLKTTSYITSAVHIDFDYYPEAKPASVEKLADFVLFPTVTGGFSRVETQIESLLTKLQAMPIETALKALTGAAEEGKATAAALRKILDDPAMDQLPAELKGSLNELRNTLVSLGPNGTVQADLSQTMEDLREVLQSIHSVAKLIEKKPNVLIFGRDDDEEEKRSPKHSLSKPGPPHRR